MKKETKKILFKFLFLIIILAISYIYETYMEKEIQSNTKIEMREKTKPTINTTSEESFHIYFIDVGQADSILIENNKEYALIDAGNNEDGKKLVNYLKSLGINQFQYVIGTHAHEDHIGGMDDIINNFKINHYYMPDVITTTKTFEDILDSLKSNNITFETPEINSTFSLSNTTFKVLYVGNDKTDLNNTSIVLKAYYQNTSYLFMADAPSSIERIIIDKDIKSDVLKVGHHGSQYSTSAVFLKKVEPKYAIIEVGKENIYNHPKEITLKKLNKLGIKTYRTDIDGTIILTSNGNDITFQTEKTDTNG